MCVLVIALSLSRWQKRSSPESCVQSRGSDGGALQPPARSPLGHVGRQSVEILGGKPLRTTRSEMRAQARLLPRGE